MSQRVFCEARTKEQANELVERLQTLGVEPQSVSTVFETVPAAPLAHSDSKHFHDMKNGAVVGAIVGFGYGAATLFIIGSAVPGLFGTLVLLGFAGLGGVLLGGIIGSTGVFGRRAAPAPVERGDPAEAQDGRILISVLAQTEKERIEFMECMRHWGASNIHFSGKTAA